MTRPDPEAGSVLIYILIGVVLFAILAAAMSRTDRGGMKGPEEDVDRLQASEILQYGRSVQTAVQAMIIDGTDPAAVSFENGTVAGYANAACTANSCRVFATSGGGVAYVPPLAGKWLDSGQAGVTGYGAWVFTAGNAFAQVGVDDGSDAADDLTMILPGVKKSLCLQFNTMLGIDNPGGDAPKIHADADLSDKFTGAFHFAQALGPGNAALNGQRAGCFQGAGNPPAGSYHIFQVLVSR